MQETTTKYEYPVTKKVDTVDVYFGHEVPDPYRWLEDDNSDETAEWVLAQNKITNDYLAQIPFREQLKKRLTASERALEKYFHARRKEEGRSHVGVNVVGSGNTALMEIGFSPNAAWCLGSVCRGFSCAAHALFNMKKGRAWGASRNEPMVQMIDLSMIKYVGPEDRRVPKQEEREDYARKQKEEGEYKKWVI